MNAIPTTTIGRRRTAVAVVAAALCVPHADVRAAPIFTGIGHLPIGVIKSSGANGVSSDGTVVAGSSQARAIRWTAEGGIEQVGVLPGGTDTSVALAVSGDGVVIVGQSSTETSVGVTFPEAIRWTEAGGTDGLGTLGPPPRSNVPNSSAIAASFDGSVIVGETTSPIGSEAFRWTEASGMVGLGTLDGHIGSVARDISTDGTLIVGDSRVSSAGREAYRWTKATGMVGLGVPPGDNTFSSALAISDNGQFVVGLTGLTTTISGEEAVLWNPVGNMIGLGNLPDGRFTRFSPSAVTDDGSLVVGQGLADSGPEAFIWDPTNGMRLLQSVLMNDFGVDLGGWTLRGANDMTFDGNTIVGVGINPNGDVEGWIVTGLPTTAIPEPSTLLLPCICLVGIALARREER